MKAQTANTTGPSNPFHTVYDAMPKDQQIEHIQGHAAVVESWVAQYKRNSSVVVDLRADGQWSEAMFYRARISCCSKRFALDRKHTVKAQWDHLEYFIGLLQAQHELHSIINLHGITEKK